MSSTTARLLLLALIVAVVLVFFAWDLDDFITVEGLTARRDALQAYRAAHPVLAAAAFLFAYIAMAAVSLPGAGLWTVFGGAVFGLALGTVLVSFASSIGATLAFFSARFVLRDWVQARLGHRLEALNEGIRRDGARYLITIRLVPVFPFLVVNLVLGLSPIGPWTFYWASQVGMLPGTLIFVYAGTQLTQFRVGLGLLAALALLGVFTLLTGRLVDGVAAWRVYRPWRRHRPRHYDYNVVVIGAGSAGLVASYIAAATKAKVALVEKHRLGGECLNTGCVPSKALIRSSTLLAQISRAREWGIADARASFNFAEVMDRVARVISAIEPHDSAERYSRLGVDVRHATAVITSPWTVEVQNESGTQTLTTRNIVVAAGSRPVVPPLPGLQEAGFVTSDSVWDLREQPRRLVVLGGGPVGCELAQAFARLGSKVTLVEKAPRLLAREDPDVSAVLHERFTAEGIDVRTGCEALRASATPGGRGLHVSQGGVEAALPFDTLLVALGRAANTAGYGLETLGIPTTPSSTVETNGFLQTRYPNIYACGDVAGPYQFTHVAAHQAWYASVNALFGSLRRFKADYRAVPWATFTDPQVARVGLNEDEARAAGTPYTVSTYGLDDLDRAIVDGEAHGFMKVLTRPGTDVILGATCVGTHAAEVIAEFVLAMTHGLGLGKVLATIHIYPTFAEANKYVAGVWRRGTVTAGQERFLTAFHAWKRGAGGLSEVLGAAPALLRRERR